MLRLVVWLAVIVLSTAAHADPAEQAASLAAHAGENIANSGLIGSIAIVVGLASVVLHVAEWLVIRALWTAIKERDAIISGLQDKRAAEAADAAKSLAGTSIAGSNAIATNSERMTTLATRIEKVEERVNPLPGDHLRMLAGLDANGGKMDALGGKVEILSNRVAALRSGGAA